MPTLRQQLDEAKRHIASLHARYVQAEQWRQEAIAETEPLKEELALIRDGNALAARLKEMTEKAANAQHYLDRLNEIEACLRMTGDYSEYSETVYLCEAYIDQKAKIAELENALCIEGHRLTEAWKTITNLRELLLD